MKFLGDAVYVEKYTNKEGEEKKKYTNVGAFFERDDKSICMKFLGSWINCYPKKAKSEDFQDARKAVESTHGPAEDEIPF